MNWSVGAAIDALAAGLDSVADVPVFDGWPGEAVELQCIWIGDSESEEQIAGFTGGRERTTGNDVYALDVFCEATLPGGTAKDARDEVLQLASTVETWVAQNRRLTTTAGVLMARVSRKRMIQLPTENGRQAIVRIEVTITARRS